MKKKIKIFSLEYKWFPIAIYNVIKDLVCIVQAAKPPKIIPQVVNYRFEIAKKKSDFRTALSELYDCLQN